MIRSCDLTVTGGILFLLLFTPFAFGSVHPWAFSLMEAVVFLLVAVWMGKLFLLDRRPVTGDRSSGRFPSPVFGLPSLVLSLALFFTLILVQLLPLPPFLLHFLSPSTYQLYATSLPGWPARSPYAEGDEWQATNGELGIANSEGQRTNGKSRIANGNAESKVPVSDPRPTSRGPQTTFSTPRLVLLPTAEEVRNGAAIPFSRPAPVPGTRSPEVRPSEITDQTFDIRYLISDTWRSLSIAPSLTRTSLLKFIAYGSLFFLVLLYPFGQQISEVRDQRSEARKHGAGSHEPRGPSPEQTNQSAIHNSQSSVGHPQSGVQNSQFEFRNSKLTDPRSEMLSVEEKFFRIVLLVILLSGFLVAVVGLVHKLSWNGKILWFFVPYDWGRAATGTDARASGPFIDPDHFANYLSLIFPLALTGALYRTSLFSRSTLPGFRLLSGFIALVLFSGVLLSLSRSGWMSALLGMSVLLWISPWRSQEPQPALSKKRGSLAARYSLALLCLLLIVSLFFVGPEGRREVDIRLGKSVMEDMGLSGRVLLWSDALAMAKDFPLLGLGLGSWAELFPQYRTAPWSFMIPRQTHNDYLELLIETGVIGIVLLIWFFLQWGRTVIRGLGSLPPRSLPLLAALLSALGVMAFHEFFDFNLQIPANAFLFTLLLALALRIAGSKEQGAGSRERAATSHEPRVNESIRHQKSEAGGQSFPASQHSKPRSPDSPGIRFPAFKFAAVGLLALLLVIVALNQEMVPYPYNLKQPSSVAEARELILSHPARAAGHVVLGRLLEESGLLAGEVNEYEIASRLEPTNPYIRDLYASGLLKMGRKGDALREISQSVLNAPSFSYHFYLNERLLPWLSEEEKGAVEAGFKRALAHRLPEAMGNLASFYESFGRFSDEGKLFEEASARTRDAAAGLDYSIKAAQLYLRAGEEKKAETVLQRAIPLVPDDPRSYQMLAVMIYGPRKEIDAAQKVISEGIKNGAPAFSLYLSLAQAMQKAGAADEAEKAWSQAREAPLEAAKKGDDPFPLYLSLAETAQQVGNRLEEKSALLQALELHPYSSEILNRLGQIHLQENNFDRAAFYLGRYAELNPDSADVFYSLATAEEGRYRFDAADKAYARALQLAPQNESFRQRYEALKAKIAANRKPDSEKAGKL